MSNRFKVTFCIRENKVKILDLHSVEKENLYYSIADKQNFIRVQDIEGINYLIFKDQIKLIEIKEE